MLFIVSFFAGGIPTGFGTWCVLFGNAEWIICLEISFLGGSVIFGCVGKACFMAGLAMGGCATGFEKGGCWIMGFAGRFAGVIFLISSCGFFTRGWTAGIGCFTDGVAIRGWPAVGFGISFLKGCTGVGAGFCALCLGPPIGTFTPPIIRYFCSVDPPIVNPFPWNLFSSLLPFDVRTLSCSDCAAVAFGSFADFIY